LAKLLNDKVVLVFDSFNDPHDIAIVVNLCVSQNIKAIFCNTTTGPFHHKTLRWLKGMMGAKENSFYKKFVEELPNLETCVKKLKSKKNNYEIVGLYPKGGENFFEMKFEHAQNKQKNKKNKLAFVFGSENGLSEKKATLFDRKASVLMQNGGKFFSVGALAPAITFWALNKK
jgi:tRNA G18 (ribose-2'-O)-methylase SpoU